MTAEHLWLEILRNSPTAPTPAGSQHPDDAAVDRFAVAMKAKLAKARDKGRGGWDNPDVCSLADLSEALRGHVEKGDPVDVANFCMMLQQRGSGIQPADNAAQDVRNQALEDAAAVCESRKPASREEFPEHWKAYEKVWGMREFFADECAMAIRALKTPAKREG